MFFSSTEMQNLAKDASNTIKLQTSLYYRQIKKEMYMYKHWEDNW